MTKFSAPQQSQLAQIGAFLRDNREKQAKSLEDIAIRTYIRPQLLNGIETGNPDTLPEPIFVQGFIRRYAEALGLNGVDLSQQFTVTSIPSTPRPLRAEPPVDSATTRFTRANGSANGVSAKPATAADDIPMFSAGSLSSAPISSAPTGQDDLLTLGKREPALETNLETNADFDNANLTGADTDEIPNAEAAFADASFSDDSFADTPNDNGVSGGVLDSESTLAGGIAPDKLGTGNGLLNDDAFAGSELDRQFEAASQSSDAALSEDFASQVAAFDRDNLNSTQRQDPDLGATNLNEPNFSEPAFGQPNGQPDSASNLDPDLASNSLNSQTTLEPTRFDDDLPAAFTTQSGAQPTVQPAAQPAEPFNPQTVREPMPVGVDYGDRPNLKPFIIGGVLAAVALGVLLLTAVFGGGNREPVVADAIDPVEQVEEGTDGLPPIPEETSVEAAPPASTAPVYVEATATAEAWVSVIADGEPVFEGTLQPGDAQVWEAQENLNIYSGDAGALELAANGDQAEVMGERGQPEEKIFTQ